MWKVGDKIYLIRKELQIPDELKPAALLRKVAGDWDIQLPPSGTLIQNLDLSVPRPPFLLMTSWHDSIISMYPLSRASAFIDVVV